MVCIQMIFKGDGETYRNGRWCDATSRRATATMATDEEDGYDSDGCRFSGEPTEARKALERARRAWSSLDGRKAFWTRAARWTQTTTCVEITVELPLGTRAEDVCVDIETTRVRVRVRWHGEVRSLTGCLRRRARADESVWTLSTDARECELFIALAKDDDAADAPPWPGVIEGGECSKSPTEVLTDMVHADEPYRDSDELCVETKSLVHTMRERYGALARGLLTDPTDAWDLRFGVSLEKHADV